MATHVVSALIDKYRRLLGELSLFERDIEKSRGAKAWDTAVDHYDRRKHEIDESLVHLEAVIWLFDEKWDPSTAKPIVPRAEFEHAKIANAAYGVLRDASGHFLSARELANYVAARLDVDADASTKTKLGKVIATACDRQVKRGYFVVQEGPPKRWTVGKLKQASSSAMLDSVPSTKGSPSVVANTPSMLPMPRFLRQP
jgi:hypothetical protein